jgi:pSer/pThr/pTyr-binding forkhead associated (FHA) protein
VTGSVAVEEALLLLKVAFLVLLYFFIWRIVRTASRDLRLPQESMVLAPHQARQLLGSSFESGRLVVLQSPVLDQGSERALDSSAVTVGRGPQNDLVLEGDEFASAAHARFEPRRDGVWVEDVGSTNGTFVNGARLEEPRRLRAGDVVRIGGTDLRYMR